MKCSRQALGLLLAAVLIVSAIGYAEYTDPRDDLSGEIVVIHTNDTHGYFDENLGFTSVAAAREYYDCHGAAVLTLDAGDVFQGTASTTITDGASALSIFNSVGYDVIAPGNHDFDYGYATLLSYYSELDCQKVCANITYTATGENFLPSYTVIERYGVSIGVFGLITSNMPTLVKSSCVDGLTFGDPVAAAAETVATLQDLGVDYIVAIGHLGIDHSQSAVTSDDVCAEVDGIDVFIDGHSHTAMAGGKVLDGSVTLRPSGTVIASTGAAIMAIGVVTIDGGQITAKLEMFSRGSDAEMDACIAQVRTDQEKLLGRIIGKTAALLDGEYADVRTKETNLGDMVADGLCQVTGADVACVNGGSLRASIPAGDITLSEYLTSLPFTNWVQVRELSGKELLDMMERSLSYGTEPCGGFMQFSGMTVTYDPTAEVGARVMSITVGGQPLDANRIYTLASTDFVFGGGDGYTMLTNLKLVEVYGDFNAIILSYMQSLGVIDSIQMSRLIAV